MRYVVRVASQFCGALYLSFLFVSCGSVGDRNYLRDPALSETGVEPAEPVVWYSLNQAYLAEFSAQQGGFAKVYVSTKEPYELQLRRWGVNMTLVWSGGPYEGAEQVLPADAPWANSLNWKNPVAVPIDEDYPSGWYQLTVKYASGGVTALQFVVTEDDPGSASSILVLDNATTRAAYNNFGGRSVYTFNSLDEIKAPVVNLRRPGQNIIKLPQKNFLRWADYAEIQVEWASSMDLHHNPDLLDNYSTLMLVEHSEYWSKEMRDALDEFLANGGNLISMSGNTMWWQIRIEDDQMIAYKWAGADPLNGVQNELVTTNFCEAPVNDPENRTIGVSFLNGGYHNSDGFYMASQGYGGYDVTNQSHPLFAGTGLQNGETFGKESTIVGYEADGALFTMVDGVPVVTGEDGTPPTMEILATAPAATPQWEGTATFVAGEVGENGGQVINMATVDWADGLWDSKNKRLADPLVSKITLNAIAATSPGMGAECPTDSCHSNYNDADGDLIDDKCDTCVLVYGSNLDSDYDGTGDVCEMPDI